MRWNGDPCGCDRTNPSHASGAMSLVTEMASGSATAVRTPSAGPVERQVDSSGVKLFVKSLRSNKAYRKCHTSMSQRSQNAELHFCGFVGRSRYETFIYRGLQDLRMRYRHFNPRFSVTGVTAKDARFSELYKLLSSFFSRQLQIHPRRRYQRSPPIS
jgi:hypothetical protein